MAVNSIRILDDTILKLSINQGIEPQRSTETLGTFTMGELAFTRDTGRVFVGDNSDFNHHNLQQTTGGSLVGNKYIGFIDSRPLASFTDNTTPLYYERQTSATGGKEREDLTEEGLLYGESKFRLSENQDGEPLQSPYDENNFEWKNWDRTAVYNDKIGAYTGDYFFDIYKNALILVDHRIKNGFSPEYVMDEESGLPVTPQTFKVVNEDGIEEQISSEDVESLKIQRRTPIQNYLKPNSDNTTPVEIYGDGYVIMRILEPDNQTIRFKPRGFDRNGVPNNTGDGGLNYNHNLLEVFYVPLSAISGHFSDDFLVTDSIYLNKEIQNVVSITCNGTGLKLPNQFIFSNPAADRGSIGYMAWNFTPPPTVKYDDPDDEYNKYKIRLVPKQEATDAKDGSKYPEFDVIYEKEEPPKIQDYYFNLRGGLQSDQDNPNVLRLDEDSITPLTAPTLTFKMDEVNDGPLIDCERDPFGIGYGSYTIYSNNFGLGANGLVKYIDEYEEAYYERAKDIIDKYEEQNTSVNYLKTPVTIMSTSSNPNLYTSLNGGVYSESTVSCASAPATGTRYTSAVSKNVNTILNQFTGINQTRYGTNNAYVTSTSTVKYTPSTQTMTVPDYNASGGSWMAVSSAALANGYEVEKVILSATISNLTKSSNTDRFIGFVAIKNGNNLVKVETFEQYYSNFSFTFSFNASEVLCTGSTYLVVGVINTNLSTTYDLKIDKLSVTRRQLDVQQQFELSRTGINAYLDFVSEPYLYCSRKVVSTPDTNMLPKVDNINKYPGGKLNATTRTQVQTYLNGFTQTHAKTWNNMVTVLGHNHFMNNIIEDSTVPILTRVNFVPDVTKVDTIIKKVFKQINGFEVDPENNYAIVQHQIDGNGEALAVFSWWEEYEKNEDGTKKTDSIRWRVEEKNEVRDEEQVLDEGDDIDYVKIGRSEVNYLESTNAGIVIGTEVDYGDGWYGIRHCLMPESPLLKEIDNDLVTFIRYGRAKGERVIRERLSDGLIRNKTIIQQGWNCYYDLYERAGLSYSYKIKSYDQTADGLLQSDDITKIAFVKNGIATLYKIDELQPILDTGLTVDSILPNSNLTPSDFDYMVVSYDDPYTDEIEEFLNIYQLVDCTYLKGVYEPRQIANAQLGESNTKVTVDERVDEESKVYIPKHARAVVLEMTHITSVNNTVGVFYCNEFEDLGHVISGYGTEEYAATPATFTNELRLNPWYQYPNDPYSGYVNGKLTLPKSKSNEKVKFHSTTGSLPTTKPSIYSAAPREKVLVNSSSTETRILEVPFQASNYSGVRHFALRIANLRPATAESANYFCLKVIGYRM